MVVFWEVGEMGFVVGRVGKACLGKSYLPCGCQCVCY